MSLNAQALWYVSRGTGLVSLILLTAVVVLGVLVNRRGRLPGLPRFAVTGLHRNLALMAVAFLGVHVVTALADSYVHINPLAALIPFASSYKPLWLGLGAVAIDIGAAVLVTSLLRARIPARVWRFVHWTAYALYPAALLHSFGSSTDLRSGLLRDAGIGCLTAVILAVAVRLGGTRTAAAAVEQRGWS